MASDKAGDYGFEALAKKIAFVLLFSFFISRIVDSVTKLQEHKIGTSSKTVGSERVLFPTITLCPGRMEHFSSTDFDLASISRRARLVDFLLTTNYSLEHVKLSPPDMARDNRSDVFSQRVSFSLLEKGKGAMLDCATFEPPGRTIATFDAMTEFFLNVTSADLLYVFVYNSGQLCLPNFSKVFGSTNRWVFLTWNEDDGRKRMLFDDLEITRVRVKALDHPQQRCDATNEGPGIAQCISDYVDAEVGCIVPWQRRSKSKSSNQGLCNTRPQVLDARALIYALSSMDENRLFDRTGCLAPCERDEFSLTPRGEVVRSPMPAGVRQSFMKVRFAFSSGRHEVREQYVVYDLGSFVADAGGYLGLLLGYSAYSVACDVVDLFKRARPWLAGKAGGATTGRTLPNH